MTYLKICLAYAWRLSKITKPHRTASSLANTFCTKLKGYLP